MDGGFEDLFNQLFDRYIEIRVDSIIGSLEDRMYDGRFEWSSSKEPHGVDSYIKYAILQIIEVLQNSRLIIGCDNIINFTAWKLQCVITAYLEMLFICFRPN